MDVLLCLPLLAEVEPRGDGFQALLVDGRTVDDDSTLQFRVPQDPPASDLEVLIIGSATEHGRHTWPFIHVSQIAVDATRNASRVLRVEMAQYGDGFAVDPPDADVWFRHDTVRRTW